MLQVLKDEFTEKEDRPLPKLTDISGNLQSLNMPQTLNAKQKVNLHPDDEWMEAAINAEDMEQEDSKELEFNIEKHRNVENIRDKQLMEAL